MTREEAINVLNDYDINFERHTAEEVAEAHEMAIKVLQQQPSENEKIIRISKGTLKARTGKYVIYDVEWLKEHFNTTEAKIYGQPNEDCISRKAVLDSLHSCFTEGFNKDKWWNSTHVLDAINEVPSIQPQSKEEPQQKTGHWFLSGGYWRCSECKEKALLKLDKATGGYREYEPVRSKYCPECGAKMQEVQNERTYKNKN